MSYRYLFILALFFSCSLYASNDSTKLESATFKLAKTISALNTKLTQGHYEEVIKSCKRISTLKKYNDVITGSSITTLQLLNAKAQYLSLSFDKALELSKTASNTITTTNEETLKKTIALADFYIFYKDFPKALSYLVQADSIQAIGKGSTFTKELILLNADYLTQVGFYKEALVLLTPIQLLLKAEAELSTKKTIKKTKIEIHKAKVQYAYLLVISAEAQRYISTYSEAILYIETAKKWIKTHAKENDYAYATLSNLEATLLKEHDEKSKIVAAYKNAYTTLKDSEYEELKLTSLSSLIGAQYSYGDVVSSDNYLRRLQMYAFRNVGKEERVQLAYEFTVAFRLYSKGELENATTRIHSLLNRFKDLPSNHPYALKIQTLQIAIAQKMGDIITMQKLRLKHAETIALYFGTNSPKFHKDRLEIAVDEIYYGSNFTLAEAIFKESYDEVISKEIDEESVENSHYLQAYSELYLIKDDIKGALSKQLKATATTKKAYPDNAPEYASSLSNYIETLLLAGYYKQAQDSIKSLNLLCEKLKGDHNEEKQAAYLGAASANKQLGEYDKSKSLLKDASKLKSKSIYEQNILYVAEAADQLANLTILTGDYYKVDKILIQAKKKIIEKLGENSPKLINIYLNYARLYLANGNYAALDFQLTSAQSLIDSIYGSNSLLMRECQLIFGDYLVAINDIKKASEAYAKAEAIQKHTLGLKHLTQVEILLRQAILLSIQGNAKKNELEKLYKDALEIVKSTLGNNVPMYAIVQQKYSEFLISQKKFDLADTQLEEVDKFWIAKLGKENTYSAGVNILRGDVAYAKSNNDEAEKKYSNAKNSYQSIFGDKHPDYVKSIGKLARVYYMKKQVDKALSTMNEIIPIYLTYTQEIFPSLSFRQKTIFWNSLKDEFEFYTSIALLQQKSGGSNYTGQVYNNTLATKAILLSSSIKLLDKITHSEDTVLIDLYTKWIAEKQYQISTLSLSKTELQEQGIQPVALQASIERLEKEMAQRSEAFSSEKKNTTIEWEDVRSKLKDNEYAIEIIRFRKFNKILTDSIYYAALIIDKNTKDGPTLILLPKGEQMEKRNLTYYRNTITLNREDEFSYDLYWQPIKSKIPDGAILYLSCDGVYNQLNIETLPIKGTEIYAIDLNKIVLLTNTKDLLFIDEETSPSRKKKTKESKRTININPYVFCGSPTFYTQPTSGKKTIVDLPGAETEIRELNNLIVTSNKTSTIILQQDVTEKSIKDIRSPKVLHIATHGYFKETISKGKGEDELTNNPLLNSGIMLVGSGDIVDNPNNTYVNQKDGILTAYEAMDLPLENTEAVVLSACETGRGEVSVGEGVYGLQRAFLIAGAKSVVISLFKVSDEITQKLMVSFYQKWISTGDKQNAFREAKLEIKKEYKDPLYWGAFIMIEGKPERTKRNP